MKRSEIGRRIERVRLKIGLSTLEFAKKIGKSQATISRIENGKQGISIELLSSIAEVLRIHPFGLLTDISLRHSVLLPPIGTIRSDAPMRILARTLENGRVRASLTIEQAADYLNIEADELNTIEMGYALPDQETLQKMADLYPVDAKMLLTLADVEKNHPAISERLATTEHLLQNILRIFEKSHSLLQQSPAMQKIQEEMRQQLGIAGESQAAERKASYFSIGHLSDTLLEALQEPAFHEKVEGLAKEYLGNQAQATGKTENAKKQPSPVAKDREIDSRD
jgi:transcriptional regulator with XRE-family HTH domain